MRHVVEVRVAEQDLVNDVDVLGVFEIEEGLHHAQTGIQERVPVENAVRAPLNQRVRNVRHPVRVGGSNLVAVGAVVPELGHPCTVNAVHPKLEHRRLLSRSATTDVARAIRGW
jgi:hypothetical protein